MVIIADKDKTMVGARAVFCNTVTIYVAIGINGSCCISVAVVRSISASILAQVEGDKGSVIHVIRIGGQAVGQSSSNLVARDGEVIEIANGQGLQNGLLLCNSSLLNDVVSHAVLNCSLTLVLKVRNNLTIVIPAQHSRTSYFFRKNQNFGTANKSSLLVLP